MYSIKKIYLLFFLFHLGVFCFAQQSATEPDLSFSHRLAKYLTEGKNQELIATIHAHSSEMDSLLAVELLSTAYLNLGISDSSLYYTQQFKALAEQGQNQTTMIDAYNGMALVYHNFLQLDSALNYYLKAMDLAGKLKMTDREALLCNNIGIVFGQQNQFEKSMDYFQRGRDLSIEVGDTILLIQSHMNIGRWHLESGDADTAVKEISEARLLAEQSQSIYDLVGVLSFLGMAYERQGRIELAEQTLKEAYYGAEEAKLLKEKVEIAISLGQTYNDQQSYRQALIYIKEGIIIAKEQNLREFLKDGYQAASIAYEGIGDFQRALAYQKLHNELYAKIFSETANRQQAEQEAIFQNELKETENQNLREQAVAQKRIIANRNYLLLAIGIIVILTLILAYNAYIGRQQTKKLNYFLEEKVEEKNSALIKKNKALEQSNLELQSFAYIASHDMKEPLRNINSYVELLDRTIPQNLSEGVQKYLGGIKRNAKDLYRLVEDVLQFTIQDQEETKFESVSFEHLIRRVEDACEILIQSKSASITHQNLPVIHCNRSKWFIILKNLVENALKYNKSASPKVNVKYFQDKKEHHLVVVDNGIGIDQKYHDRIFGMFKRLHTRKEFEGTGLGLSTCKKLMEQMGGTINVCSEVGKGATFTCTWPVK